MASVAVITTRHTRNGAPPAAPPPLNPHRRDRRRACRAHDCAHRRVRAFATGHGRRARRREVCAAPGRGASRARVAADGEAGGGGERRVDRHVVPVRLRHWRAQQSRAHRTRLPRRRRHATAPVAVVAHSERLRPRWAARLVRGRARLPALRAQDGAARNQCLCRRLLRAAHDGLVVASPPARAHLHGSGCRQCAMHLASRPRD